MLFVQLLLGFFCQICILLLFIFILYILSNILYHCLKYLFLFNSHLVYQYTVVYFRNNKNKFLQAKPTLFRLLRRLFLDALSTYKYLGNVLEELFMLYLHSHLFPELLQSWSLVWLRQDLSCSVLSCLVLFFVYCSNPVLCAQSSLVWIYYVCLVWFYSVRSCPFWFFFVCPVLPGSNQFGQFLA